MNQLVLLFGLAFVVVLVVTPLVGILANRLNIVDVPGGRHLHDKVVPRMGGVAIFIGFALLMLWTIEMSLELWTVLGAGFVLLLIGMWDDAFDISPWSKLFAQIAAIILLLIGGVQITTVGNPFTTALFSLGTFSAVVTLLWIMVLMNAVNWTDGMDGLVSGVSLIAALVLAVLSWDVGHTEVSRLALILAGALGGFLVYNFYPAKIFLGDSGSMFVGFMLAVLGFLGGAKIATAILVLGVPLIDGGFTALNRLINKKPLHVGDRSHLHFRLLAGGFTQVQVVLIFYTLAAVFGGIAIFAKGSQKILALGVLLVVFTLIWAYLAQLAKKKR